MTVRLQSRTVHENSSGFGALTGSFPSLLSHQVFSDRAHEPVVKAVGHKSGHEHQWLGVGAYSVASLGTRGLDGPDDLASYDVGIRSGTSGGEEQCTFFFSLSGIRCVTGRLL